MTAFGKFSRARHHAFTPKVEGIKEWQRCVSISEDSHLIKHSRVPSYKFWSYSENSWLSEKSQWSIIVYLAIVTLGAFKITEHLQNVSRLNRMPLTFVLKMFVFLFLHHIFNTSELLTITALDNNNNTIWRDNITSCEILFEVSCKVRNVWSFRLNETLDNLEECLDIRYRSLSSNRCANATWFLEILN